MNPTLSQRVIPLEDVLFQDVGGEAVLLDLGSENYFGLDPVGTRVWQMLVEDPSLQKVYDALISEFEVEEDRLQSDLVELVGKLADAGLVRVE